MSSHRAATLLLVGVVLLVATGTGAFSSAVADRSVRVAVVPDEQAYLGIESEPVELDNGAHGPSNPGNGGGPGQPEPPGVGAGGARADVTLLTLTNRFPGPVEEVVVTPADGELGTSGTPPNVIANSLEVSDSIGVGETAEVTARVVCSGAAENEETWRFTVIVRGASFSVETTATVTVRCTGEPPASAAENAAMGDDSAAVAG